MTRPPSTDRRRTSRCALVVTAAALLGLPATAGATTPLGEQHRISATGGDGDPTRFTSPPEIAYNSSANEFLVVWQADGLATDNEFEIFAQRATASGEAIGPVVRISTTGADGDATRAADHPAVAYNPQADEYLVAWDADGLTKDNEFEIFVQRVSGAGTEIGSDRRISTTGADGDATRDASTPAIAANARTGEYLVVWEADGLATDDEHEVFAQRLDAAADDLGPDQRISVTGADGDATRDVFTPTVAYNAKTNEYLVAWQADALATDDEFEIFGQRLSATVTAAATPIRISTTASDGDANRAATEPSIAANSSTGEYLVGWHADGLATDNEFEVFAQRLSAASTAIDGRLRVSTTAADGDSTRGAFSSAIAYDPAADEYLVTWYADAFAADDEYEVLAARLDGDGTALGQAARVSTTGADGDPARDGQTPAIAFGTRAREYLVAWQADGLTADDEFEVFARRHGAAAPIAPQQPDTTPPALVIRAVARQPLVRQRGVRLTGSCNEDCQLAITTRVRIGDRRRPTFLAAVRRTAGAGTRVRIAVPFPRAVRRALAAAIARRARVVITLTVTATDPAGNSTRTRRAVTPFR